jgi:DNA-binding beta-propeller fold protein YncE
MMWRSAQFSAVLAGCALALGGCRPTSETQLRYREWRTWQLPPEGPSLPTPRSLALGPSQELGVLDTAGRVLIYDAQGRLLRMWRMLDVSVGKPEGLAFLRDGSVVVCDTHYHRIVVFDAAGRWLKNFGRKGEGRGEFIYPVGICIDPQEHLYICEYGGHDRVQKFTREGEWLGEFGKFGTGPDEFQRPSGLVWHEGRLYIADAINHRVLVFSDDGEFLGHLGEGGRAHRFGFPYDITLGPDGLLYIIEYSEGRLSRLTPGGEWRGRLGRLGSGEAEFSTPWGLAVNGSGRVFVADTRNRRIASFFVE